METVRAFLKVSKLALAYVFQVSIVSSRSEGRRPERSEVNKICRAEPKARAELKPRQ